MYGALSHCCCILFMFTIVQDANVTASQRRLATCTVALVLVLHPRIERGGLIYLAERPEN